MKTYIIETEKSSICNAGYLNNFKVVEDINDAEEFATKEAAQDETDLFKAEFGKSGKIIARVREFVNNQLQ